MGARPIPYSKQFLAPRASVPGECANAPGKCANARESQCPVPLISTFVEIAEVAAQGCASHSAEGSLPTLQRDGNTSRVYDEHLQRRT